MGIALGGDSKVLGSWFDLFLVALLQTLLVLRKISQTTCKRSPCFTVCFFLALGVVPYYMVVFDLECFFGSPIWSDIWQHAGCKRKVARISIHFYSRFVSSQLISYC